MRKQHSVDPRGGRRTWAQAVAPSDALQRVALCLLGPDLLRGGLGTPGMAATAGASPYLCVRASPGRSGPPCTPPRERSLGEEGGL